MRLRGATGGASIAPSVRCNSGGRATTFQLRCLHRSTTPTWTRTSTAASASVFCSATSPSFKVENWRSFTSEGARKSNRLALEKSPYLLQHQHNPVDWLPYGKEAFEKAKQLDRPLFISIGYLSCHWCHVMERESFEDEKVAQVLNNNFVPVKVDREEMPDVDTIYLRAAMSLRVSCGWPLSVWATPEGHAFHAGTYFPKELFLKVLDQVTKSWQNQRDVLQSLSESVQQLTQQTTSIFDTTNPLPSVSVLKKAIEQAEELFDAEWGGFGRPPKFPMSVRLQFLMRMYLRIPDKRISDMVEKTLQSMAWGGLYDHLGGGFARYSTDRQWLIPHFEKMLYDNALLAQTYVEAFLLTKNPTYASIAKETLHYVLNRMENKELGGFYSAEDADSEGKEGKFYVWTNAQLQSLLTAEEFELVRAVYGVTRDGNFEHGTTHLSLQKNCKWEDKKQPLLRSAHEKLFRARKQRIHPLRDDKQLVSWNALMIKAMAAAAQAFNEEHERDYKKAFLEAAQRAAHFIRDKLYNPETGTLYRRYIDGDVRYEGTLDDYAYLISALLTLYQTDWNASWLKWAIELQRHQDDFFWDKASSSSSSQQQTEQGGYFFTPDNMDESLPLIARTKEFTDGSIPNPNSVSILNLLKLNAFTYRVEYKRKAHHILRLIQPALNAAPAYFSQSLLAIDFALSNGQLAIVLPSSEASEETEGQKAEMISALRRLYLPNVVIAIGREAVANEGTREEEAFVPPLLQGKTALNGRVTAYFCEGYTCKRPVQNGDELTQQLLEHIRAHRF